MDTPQRIRQAAERLSRELRPGAAGVAQIAAAAGVSRTTFYRHFRSRRALLEEIAGDRATDDPSLLEPNTRGRILEAALQCFSQAGFHSTSMGAIAKQAGLSRAGVTWHFRRKEALLSALWQGLALPAPQPAPEGRSPDADRVYLQRLAQAIFDSLCARREVLRVLLEVSRQPRQAGLLDRGLGDILMPSLGGIFQHQIDEGRFRRMPIAHAVQAFLAPLVMLVLWPGFPSRPSALDTQPRDALRSFVDIYLEGMSFR